MADCRFILYHGWGFDHTFWQPWADRLSKWGTVHAYDRGYFGDPRDVEVEHDSDQTVAVTHSFGLHWIEQSLFEEIDLLVICGGFLYFHPYAAQYKRRSRLILQEMINNLEVDPTKVLADFYENCYAPEDPPNVDVEEFNHQLLLDDLRRLQNSDLSHQRLEPAQKVCILHGSDDHIVPNKKGRQIYTQLQAKSQYFEIKGGGHALPRTHARQCMEFVQPEIEALNQTE